MAPSNRTALIVEDDDDIRRLLEIVLKQSGYTTTSVASGSEALQAAEGLSTDLITVDVGLPDIDGHEVVRRLRPGYTGTIVMISARSAEGDRKTGLEAGADAYLTKPFRPRELRQSLDQILPAEVGNGPLA
ncbi:response regulator [Kocuria coralli]|uniref:Response regulator n=1 Tax=Kocuria coralli TaxID=1461025 RepID=A0A5J5KZQ0_9MICC|nr:response regulator [Kocuria coralli]KAA9394820.1 response regulator [Kocuria coralli]